MGRCPDPFKMVSETGDIRYRVRTQRFFFKFSFFSIDLEFCYIVFYQENLSFLYSEISNSTWEGII